MENVENVGNNSDIADVEVIEAGMVYYDLKTGEQVKAIKQSPKEEFWFTERLRDQKKLLLPAWGLVKEPEAYSEEGQKLAKKRSAKRRAKERKRKLEELL